MGDYENELQKALAQNAQYKADRTEALKREAASAFRNRMKLVDRILGVYLIICVVIGVSVLNEYMASNDTKTLLTCAFILVVVYETTVLLKLWYANAHTKLGILKEIKQLRLEISELASATTKPGEVSTPSTAYEPMLGASKLERRLWLVALVLAAMFTSSLSREGVRLRQQTHNVLSDDTIVTLADNGSASSITQVTQTCSGTSISFHAPAAWKLNWLDAYGRPLPCTTTPHDTHLRYDVSVPNDVPTTPTITITRVANIPVAVTEDDGVTTFAFDTEYGVSQNQFTVTVLLPENAELTSTTMEPVLQTDSNGRPMLRFQGSRGADEKFAFQVAYRLPAGQ